MRLGKYYYKELPSGYQEKKVIDAKDKKTGTILTVSSLVLTVLAFVVIILIKPLSYSELRSDLKAFLIADISFLGLLILYFVLHELTHGVGYKIFTSEKLKFGVSLTVAFCGVPSAYVKKWPAFITTLLPFTVYTIAFLLVYFLVPNIYVQAVSGLLFAIHFGGCIGDLYVATYLIFKTDKNVLINDDGAKQAFYELSKESTETNEGNISTES